MPSLPLIIWYLLVCLGVYEAARSSMFTVLKALAYAVLWPIALPIVGLIVVALEIIDLIRDHWPF